MGGNVKDAMTDTPKVTRECDHCESEFEDTVKYGPERYCPDCKDEFDDPEYIESSVELDFDEEGRLLIHVTLTSRGPDNLRVRLPGEKVEDGIIFAEVHLESDTGWGEDVVYSDEQYMYHDLKIHGERTETLGWSDEIEEEVRTKNREKGGYLLRGDEIEVTVDFYCSDVDSCNSTLTTPEAVAKNI